MRFQFSLAELFLAVTAWSVGLALFLAEVPSWVHAASSLGAVISILLLIARGRSLAFVALATFPLAWLLNWSLLFITLGYAFGGRDFTDRVFGPLAAFLSEPLLRIMNSSPLPSYWDTLFALVVMSLVQMMTVVLTMWVLPFRTRKLNT